MQSAISIAYAAGFIKIINDYIQKKLHCNWNLIIKLSDAITSISTSTWINRLKKYLNSHLKGEISNKKLIFKYFFILFSFFLNNFFFFSFSNFTHIKKFT